MENIVSLLSAKCYTIRNGQNACILLRFPAPNARRKAADFDCAAVRTGYSERIYFKSPAVRLTGGRACTHRRAGIARAGLYEHEGRKPENANTGCDGGSCVSSGAIDFYIQWCKVRTMYARLLTIGMVNDMYAESRNDEYKGYCEVATQEDYDRF